MTYKRRDVQKRTGNLGKAQSKRWRQRRAEEAENYPSTSTPVSESTPSQLTDDIIDKLSSYYGKAIRDNSQGNVHDMQRAIWATYYHLSATNKEHYHQCCPKGEDSWCFFNRADALKLPESEKDHKKKKLYLAKIPKEKLQYIKGVYKDLADPALLQRCLKGATQNPNESIHAKVWNKCSKAKFCGRMRLQFISRLTALEHNFGYEDSNIITHILGTQSSIQDTMKWMDSRRASNATPKQKKRKIEKKDESYQPGEY